MTRKTSYLLPIYLKRRQKQNILFHNSTYLQQTLIPKLHIVPIFTTNPENRAKYSHVEELRRQNGTPICQLSLFGRYPTDHGLHGFYFNPRNPCLTILPKLLSYKHFRHVHRYQVLLLLHAYRPLCRRNDRLFCRARRLLPHYKQLK